MSDLKWFKSSHSEASGNACVEVAACGDDRVAIRDSVFPDPIITTNKAAFAELVVDVGANTLGVVPD